MPTGHRPLRRVVPGGCLALQLHFSGPDALLPFAEG
jgi:hypothetical protein